MLEMHVKEFGICGSFKELNLLKNLCHSFLSFFRAEVTSVQLANFAR
jgi:hypothetical protein